MKFKSKISKFSNDRKIIEVPKSVRDNFEIGDEVMVEKKEGRKRK